MKDKHMLAPKGLYQCEPYELSPDKPVAGLPDVLLSAPLKKRAGRVLDETSARNRLTLVLGLMCVIGLGFAVPMILDCLPVIGEILTALSDDGSVLWPSVVYGILLAVVSLLFTLPLVAALFRMAALMMARSEQARDGGSAVGLGELLYPFTSARAYGRTMYVALRGLGLLLLSILPSVAVVIAAAYLIPMVGAATLPLVAFFLWLIAIPAACLLLILLSRTAAKGTGLAYLIFTCPERPIAELRRDFRKNPRRGAALPLWMLAGYVGQVILSALAVCLPLVVHVLPHMLLSWASYGRYLATTEEPREPEEPLKEACPTPYFQASDSEINEEKEVS